MAMTLLARQRNNTGISPIISGPASGDLETVKSLLRSRPWNESRARSVTVTG